jgi:hypothetical protein
MSNPETLTETIDLHLTHRLYIRAQQRRYPDGRIPNSQDVCPCINCGCAGNNECGHDCMGDDCALDECGHCPCCCNVDTPATDAEYDASVGQTDMFVEAS